MDLKVLRERQEKWEMMVLQVLVVKLVFLVLLDHLEQEDHLEILGLTDPLDHVVPKVLTVAVALRVHLVLRVYLDLLECPVLLVSRETVVPTVSKVVKEVRESLDRMENLEWPVNLDQLEILEKMDAPD